MKLNKTILLIFSAMVIVGIVIISLNSYSVLYTISGKITNVTHYARGLNPFTKVAFEGGDSISFTSHLMFEVGIKYEISYHKSGLLWELLGDDPLNTVEHINIIE